MLEEFIARSLKEIIRVTNWPHTDQVLDAMVKVAAQMEQEALLNPIAPAVQTSAETTVESIPTSQEPEPITALDHASEPDPVKSAEELQEQADVAHEAEHAAATTEPSQEP